MAKLCVEPSTLLIAAVVLYLLLDVKNPVGAAVSKTSLGRSIRSQILGVFKTLGVSRFLGAEGELQDDGAFRGMETQSKKEPPVPRTGSHGELTGGKRRKGGGGGAFDPAQYGEAPERQFMELGKPHVGTSLRGSRPGGRKGKLGNMMKPVGAAVSASAMGDDEEPTTVHMFQGARHEPSVGAVPFRGDPDFHQSTTQGPEDRIPMRR